MASFYGLLKVPMTIEVDHIPHLAAQFLRRVGLLVRERDLIETL
jgi:hypothetical protein